MTFFGDGLMLFSGVRLKNSSFKKNSNKVPVLKKRIGIFLSEVNRPESLIDSSSSSSINIINI
jgi:hypothetical protein